MNLTPNVIRYLRDTAQKYKNDPFFGIWSTSGEFFVFNWVFGFNFKAHEIMNCPHIRELEDQADLVCSNNEAHADILHHIHLRSWRDILVGQGLFQDVALIKLSEDMRYVFTEQGWRVVPFETRGHRRFYVRERYFNIANELLKQKAVPAIFRPVHNVSYPQDYRPMLFRDEDNEVRGLVRAVSEESVLHQEDPVKRYQRAVLQVTPELFAE